MIYDKEKAKIGCCIILIMIRLTYDWYFKCKSVNTLLSESIKTEATKRELLHTHQKDCNFPHF